MSTHPRTPVVLAWLVFILAALSPMRVSSQDRVTRPVFVALPQTFPDIEARVLIMREPGRDLVVLKEGDAEPEALHTALRVLARMQRDHPLPEDRGQLIPVTGFVYPGGLDPERGDELTAVLDALRQRPLANVGNLGLGHWIQYDAS